MKTMIAALFVGVIGIILVVWSVSTLMGFAEFTQTVHGTAVRKSADAITVLFREEHIINSSSESSRFAGVSEIRFPITDRTKALELGNEVEGYCPPARLAEVRLDRDFPAAAPRLILVTGSVLLLLAIGLLIAHRVKAKHRQIRVP